MIDHLVYATTDLEATVVEISERLGVAPVPGGVHTGRGTRNELVALGGATYLEIIGPDLDQPDPPWGRPFGIDRLRRPRLVGWCARPTRSLEAVSRTASTTGWDVGPISAMSRRRPDGIELAWRLTMPALDRHGLAILPFLIDWADSPHPTEELDQPLRLVRLRVECRDPERIAGHLEAVGELSAVELIDASDDHLSAVLQTPNGPISFS